MSVTVHQTARRHGNRSLWTSGRPLARSPPPQKTPRLEEQTATFTADSSSATSDLSAGDQRLNVRACVRALPAQVILRVQPSSVVSSVLLVL